jgi:hypothetical protein
MIGVAGEAVLSELDVTPAKEAAIFVRGVTPKDEPDEGIVEVGTTEIKLFVDVKADC